ncbi:MAG: transketolase family protein [Candidatus Omnitrophica bacterium]|nr:transketolase family protein [Candidatus Omnitrophota bacterium]
MEQLYARDVYGKTLIELGKKDSRVVVGDADLSSSTRTSLFAREFPERFFNFGIAEQNMMATAAGLASCGKIVFVSTFAMFASARALGQVRNTVCYNNLNVKIVATHAGITVGEDGSSHQALEDVNFLRAIPNMHIVVPADAPQAREAVIAAYQTEGPFYIRLGRSKVTTIENKNKFILGKGDILEEGKDIAIIACGLLVNEALVAGELLKKKGISATVANIHTIKPIDVEMIIMLAKKHKNILVCEEHQVTGGLFSAVAEVTSRNCPVKVERIGMEDKFGQSGSPAQLLEFYGFNADSIAKKAESIVRQ